MNKIQSITAKVLTSLSILVIATSANAQSESFNLNLNNYPVGLIFLVVVLFGALIIGIILLSYNSNKLIKYLFEEKKTKPEDELNNYMKNLWTIWSSNERHATTRFSTWTSERLRDNFDFKKMINVGQMRK